MTTRYYITTDNCYYIRELVKLETHRSVSILHFKNELFSSLSKLPDYMGYQRVPSIFMDYEFEDFINNNLGKVKEISKEEFDRLLFMQELVGSSND